MYTLERYTPLQSEGGVKVLVRGLRGKDVITAGEDMIQPTSHWNKASCIPIACSSFVCRRTDTPVKRSCR